MIQIDNRTKLLRIFFENPLPKGIGFQLRELSRKIKLAPTSVKNYLKELEKEELIIKEKHRIHGYPVYYANRDNEMFKFLKKIDTILEIKESGLLDYINYACMPDAVILFGSASRGEDIEESDIDIFVLSRESKLELGKYENILNRKINLLFNDNFNKLSSELKNNIINGIILDGYIKVF